MVKNGEHFVIKEMFQKGMNISQIASELGRDRKTIRSWLQETESRAYQRKPAVKPSLLEPFKEYVKQRMEEGCLNSVVLFDEIKSQGYAGKTTMLRYFMSPLRPVVISKATERYETPPGQQAQSRLGSVQRQMERNLQASLCFRYGAWLFTNDVCGVYRERAARNPNRLSSSRHAVLWRPDRNVLV